MLRCWILTLSALWLVIFSHNFPNLRLAEAIEPRHKFDISKGKLLFMDSETTNFRHFLSFKGD